MGTELDRQNTADRLRIAEIVRTACLRAAIERYDQAASDGLCLEGAWECALDAIRSMDLEAVLKNG